MAALDWRMDRVHGAGVSRAAILVAAVIVVAACGVLPIGARVEAPPGVTPGAAVDPGVPPDADSCEADIRSDIAGALVVRSVLASLDFGSLPIATDEAAARNAAADPASDLSAFGIPVTEAELEASVASLGEIDSMQPIIARMRAVPDAYGDLWIDGSGGVVVAVMTRDAAASLRCFEPVGREVRYVEAGWSKATLDALQDRITADWQSGALEREGIDVRMTGQAVQGDVMVVEVTVHGLTPAISDTLRRRYGDPVVPVEGEGAQPA